jgi:hypothetical protein
MDGWWRSKWFWLISAIALPFAIGVALVVLLVASPAHRVKVLAPFLVNYDMDQRRWHMKHLKLGTACRTTEGYAALIEFLNHKDPKARKLAFELPSCIDDQLIFPPLDQVHLNLVRATISDPDPEIVSSGIDLLIRHKDKTCKDAILARGRRDHHPLIINTVLAYLGWASQEDRDNYAEHLLNDASFDRKSIDPLVFLKTTTPRARISLIALSLSADHIKSWQSLLVIDDFIQRFKHVALTSDPTFQAALKHQIANKGLPFVKRQRLSGFIVDQDARFEMGKYLMSETQDYRQTIELIRQSLFCLNDEWKPYLRYLHEQVTWMSEQWVWYSPAPAGGLSPTPSSTSLVAAVRETILNSNRASARTAILRTLRDQLATLPTEDQPYVIRLMDAIERKASIDDL